MQPLQADDPVYIAAYRVLARLGSGGMGRVYLARSPGGRWVALKVIRPEFAEDTEFRARFRREVSAARLVSGAFTAPVLDADSEGPVPWVATVYVPGPSLQEAIDAHGTLTEAATRALGAALAEALMAVHDAELVHRDLKPANVLLAAEGPRVIDFGISRALDGTALTLPGAIIGTPAYMSPEHVHGDVSAASDVFSLAGVLVFALTGRAPFGSGPTEALLYRVARSEPVLNTVPHGLLPVVAACLDKDPRRRPTPRELLDLLTDNAPVDPVSWLPDGVRADLALRARRLSELENSPPVLLPSASETVRETRLSAHTGIGRRRVIALAGGTALALAGAGTAWLSGAFDRRPKEGTPSKGGTLVESKTGPVPRWTFTPELPSANARLAIGGGTVYLASGGLEAIDPSTGRRRWRAPQIISGPPLSGSQFYAFGRRHDLHVLDAATGRQQRLIESDDLKAAFAESSRLEIIGRSGGLLWVSSFNLWVAVFDTRQGRFVWKKKLADPDADVFAAIAVDEDACYIRESQALFALALKEGREMWRIPLAKGTGPLSLVRSGGSLFTSTPEGVVAFDPAGRRLWTSRTQETSSAFPVIEDVAMGGRTLCSVLGDTVVALDPASGAHRWRARSPAPISLARGLAVSSAVVAAPFDNHATSAGVTVLDAGTGAPRWSVQTPGDQSTQWILAADGSSVFAFDGIRLHAFPA